MTALAVMITRRRVPHSRRIVWLPFLPLSAITVYGAFYIAGFVSKGRFLHYVAGDMTVVFCLTICATL